MTSIQPIQHPRYDQIHNGINTTNTRILVSVGLAAYMVVSLTIAMFFGWTPTEGQKWVLIGIAGGLLTMMGFDVFQFATKRFSDAGYAAAKAAAKAGSSVDVVGPPAVSATAPTAQEVPVVVPVPVPTPVSDANGVSVANVPRERDD